MTVGQFRAPSKHLATFSFVQREIRTKAMNEQSLQHLEVTSKQGKTI